MILESVINGYDKCITYEVSESVNNYFHYIEEEPFYVSPTFTSVRTNNTVSTLNPKFILFSAPGAVGKSALARHLSYIYNAPYWNLAKLKLGTNSFAGSILNAVGPQSYSDFINDLNNAKILLILDALDEAEIISGRKMLGDFISEINDSLKNNVRPTVFLLARTETAQYIVSICADNKIPILHYEIGFFEQNQAEKFIEQSIISKSDTATSADKECIQSYYNAISSNILEKEKQSFLGYAPVLEAIAEHIKTCKNRLKMINMLKQQTSSISIIIRIMEDLLKREQCEKVIPAFKTRCAELHPEFLEWEKLYSPQEQLVRIISYVLFKDTKYINYPLEFLPPQLISDYQEIIDNFLPQHPFVKNYFLDNSQQETQIDFTGPAFRDYTLAQLLLNKNAMDYAEMYFSEAKDSFYFPSRILFDCYSNISKNKIYSNHLYYVFLSYRAKAKAMEHPYLQCSEVETDADHPQKELVALFGMTYGPKKKAEVQEEIILNVEMQGDTISFEQLSNVSLDIPNFKVCIGSSGVDSSIYNSSVICKQIIWSSDAIALVAESPEGCLIVSQNEAEGGNPNFDILNDENLKVSIPNVNEFYRLIPYKYDFDDPKNVDITKIIYAMRCIMMEFRTHKKDTLAKDWERIDNVTVANSSLKRKVLEYLKYKGIIYRKDHLYKVDTERMQNVGISYAALSRMRTDLLEKAYDDFCQWDKGKC